MAHSATLPILLKQLNLSTMTGRWEDYLAQATLKGWNPAQYLAALCEEEPAVQSPCCRLFQRIKTPCGQDLVIL